MAMLKGRSDNLGSDGHSESGNSTQFRNKFTLLCASVFSTPFERIFRAEQFDI